MSKILLIDTASVGVRAIQRWSADFLRTKGGQDGMLLPTGWIYFSMLVGFFKKIGLEKDDIIVLCLEGKSWRKKFDSSYKAQRAKQREDQKHIDWKFHFGELEKVNKQLEEAGMWRIREWHSEADDLVAVGCKYFEDKKVIIVSSDADLLQLLAYPNTYFFSVCMKAKNTNGCYKEVSNPYKIIADKVRKGDIGDNILVDKENDTEEDQDLRRFIIDLLNLPDFVVEPIKKEFEKIKPRKILVEKLPYQNSLAKRWKQVYEKDKIITPEYCFELVRKRKCRKKKKK